ncbi:MAG: lipopolysaccharide kinase InaA family protein [Desulfuromonadaceae bacterium]|nr:lipopolysaccharide kinase InaA family protein [Desulfuromonadaceae bacterium]
MKIFEIFPDQRWKKLLQNNQLADFPSIWDLKTEWFEEPNIRRGGWSGVVKYMLQGPEGPVEVFIKRQEGHVSRTFLHPLKGISTLKKEYASIKRLHGCDVPTLDPIYFASAGNKAILITLGLSEHVSLEAIDPTALSSVAKRNLLKAMATVVRGMHRHNLKHNCLYPKHIFVRQMLSTWDVRIIDLEKMKRAFLQRNAVRRDLSTLVRHADARWSIKDMLLFLRYYYGEETLSDATKKTWRAVAADVQRKKNRQ